MKLRYYIACILCCLCTGLWAEEKTDTLTHNGIVFISESQPLPAGTRVRSHFMPDPDMAVWLSAVVPGLGQIYNRQYWKLPIIYGGTMGLVYAITWNHQMYADYHKAYVDLEDGNPNTRYYEYLLPAGETITSESSSDPTKQYYSRTFKTKQDNYQRYRDLSIIGAVALYLLTLIDAYVDAQMADYDISPDLSIQVAPAVIAPGTYQQTDTSVGVRCKLKF